MDTKEMFFIRNLASAVLLQAVKDYCQGSEKEKRDVIKDLNSKWMDELTQGLSKVYAEKLLKNSEEITERVAKHSRSISVNSRSRRKGGKKRVTLYT